MLRISDCIRLAVPQSTEWQHIGNQIDAAMIFTGADFGIRIQVCKQTKLSSTQMPQANRPLRERKFCYLFCDGSVVWGFLIWAG